MVCHSIFNDVLGPVMAGPSSSHSAGCARIGKLTQILWGKEIKKAVVVYDSQGSYPSTCVGQGSNFGFTGGLLGFVNGDPRMKDSIAIAKEMGVDISFAEEKLSARHPNEARIDVYGDSGDVEMSVLTLSVGGGMFEIVELDGYPVYMDGSREQIFVRCEIEVAEKVESLLAKIAGKVTRCGKLVEIFQYRPDNERDRSVVICAEELRSGDSIGTAVRGEVGSGAASGEAHGGYGMVQVIAELEAMPGVRYVRKAEVVLPIPMKENCEAVFETAAEALQYAGDKPMWQLAIEYECSLGEVTTEDVWQQAAHTLQVMRNAAMAPDPNQTEVFGFLPYQCTDMKERAKSVQTVNTGYLDKAMFYAIAVMENSCAHNIVTAAPTAGASGVVPAAVVAVGEEMGCSDEEIIHGLLAAGLAGAFIANQATFGAEVAGCQAENGAASAMAAAGVVELLGGTPAQGFAAASMALQNMLGLICDPVGGVTEIPCISRNVAAMSNAVMSANMTMLGFDPKIPYDETIKCMYEVGQMLPSELRCTCGGGLCTTPTGVCIARGMRAIELIK